jgi:hypothetical protein
MTLAISVEDRVSATDFVGFVWATIRAVLSFVASSSPKAPKPKPKEKVKVNSPPDLGVSVGDTAKTTEALR